MSIQLKYHEPIATGLQRLAVRRAEKAKKSLSKATDASSRHKAVHHTRKAFKKIRAIARLVRDAMPNYDETNTFFRDEARKISAIRDATANLETLNLLEKQYADTLEENAFTAVRTLLEDRRRELAVEAFHTEGHLSGIRRALEDQLPNLRSWELDLTSFDDIRPGIRRVYKRGRQALRKARKTGRTEHFHEWRKRAKYLRYQMDILNRIWPAMMDAWENELHELTDLTGTDHDLQVLRATIAEELPEWMDSEAGLLLQAVTDRQQRAVKAHALLLGAKLYEASPDDFCDRLATYWKQHEREISRQHPPPAEALVY